MKLLEKFVNNNKEITLDELKELWWCCLNYQYYIPPRESCGDFCHACRRVSFPRGHFTPPTLCERCSWSKLRDSKIPKELQEYSYIYNLKSSKDVKAHPDFQKFFNKLKEKLEELCGKANCALRKCQSKYSPPREYCSSCSLKEVCNKI